MQGPARAGTRPTPDYDLIPGRHPETGPISVINLRDFACPAGTGRQRLQCLLILLGSIALATAVSAQAPDAATQASPTPAAAAAESAPATTPAGAAAASPPTVAAARPAEVRVGDTVVFALQAGHAGRSAALRARAANDALHEVLDAGDDEVRIAHAGGAAVIYVGARPVLQLVPADAALAGDASLEVHADRIAAQIRAALATEHTRSAVAGGIFGVSLAVLFAVLSVFLLRRAWQLGDRAADWLDTSAGQVPALRLGRIELFGRATVRTALSLGVAVGRWIALLGLVYAWLLATFSLFESTRSLTGQLTGALLNPLATLASRIVAAVPLLVILVFALLTLALLLRAVRLFFRDIARGTTVVGWLPRDLAAATGALTEIALIVLALVLVAPVITGNAEGAAPRMGLLGLAALALATVPLAATAIVGVATLFGRWLAVGDWVEMGACTGKVVRIGLLETTLRDAAGTELRIPHLARLLRPVCVHGPAPRIIVSLPVERGLATPALAARLAQVLAPLGSNPGVRLVEIGETRATLELAVTSSVADARSACLWAALAELEAVRRESAAS